MMFGFSMWHVITAVSIVVFVVLLFLAIRSGVRSYRRAAARDREEKPAEGSETS